MVKFSRIEIVTTFKPKDDLMLLLGPSIKKVNDNLKGKFLQLTIPNDAPFELPRYAIQLKNMLIHIGLNRIQIISEPPPHIQNSIEESFKFIQETSKYIVSTILKGNLEYLWTGIITTIKKELKAEKPIKAVYPIFKKMINLDWKDEELASFNFQIGRKIKDIFVNYTISGFEKRRLLLDNLNKNKLSIENLKNVNSTIGIQILLDINNKPQTKKADPLKDLDNIIKQQFNLSKSMSKDLNLGDILI